MNKLRLRFSKNGSAKFISHLDLMATMSRALLRAGVKLKYSEGFNPHPHISIALPLPVGCGSVCELMDFGTENILLPDGLPEIINAVLPEGIEILEAYIPQRKFCDIAWLGISGLLYYDETTQFNTAEKLAERFTATSIVITKRTKRSIADIDIVPFIRDVAFNGGYVVNLSAKVSAQNPSISPDNLMSALNDDYSYLAPDYSSFTRTEVFDDDMKVFR